MSVVIAIKKNDRIYMAADTQTSCGDRKDTYLGEDSRKIHRFDNGILLGGTGSVHNWQIICAHPESFTIPESGEFSSSEEYKIFERISPLTVIIPFSMVIPVTLASPEQSELWTIGGR